ncbi:hypothetical protein GDO78_002751 [Eleutherodactylus coqui]|uniref:Uncharacterized protein n=1 Tax=Eleutherodactylus coqui TaxID=57060 RepID=A0A8J6K2U1_ELECQ|nr:hypothetical protein GDO78_002751 [Eleutherodactylus coqui]
MGWEVPKCDSSQTICEDVEGLPGLLLGRSLHRLLPAAAPPSGIFGAVHPPSNQGR